jgi:uncharacterized protein (DUF1697 family)
MPVYVAMLRGINVGGHKKIKMDQLRASFGSMGFSRVKTYIQSGNVVFKATKTSPSALCKRIEAQILEEFGHSVSVIVRTADEMKQVVTGNPFLKEKGTDPDKLHVLFLSQAPKPSAVEQVSALKSRSEQMRCINQELYLYLPNGVGESFVMKKPIDRLLSVVTTMRNWKTVNALHQMCVECE